MNQVQAFGVSKNNWDISYIAFNFKFHDYDFYSRGNIESMRVNLGEKANLVATAS